MNQSLDNSLLPPIASSIVNNNLTKLKILLNNQHPDSEINCVDQRPIHTACLNSNHRAVKILLKQGANPNALLHESTSPLLCAIASNNALCIRMLLREKADCDWIDQNGISAKLLITHRCLLSPSSLPSLKEMIRYGVDFTISNTKIHPLYILSSNPQLWSFYLSLLKIDEQNRLIKWKKELSNA